MLVPTYQTTRRHNYKPKLKISNLPLYAFLSNHLIYMAKSYFTVLEVTTLIQM